MQSMKSGEGLVFVFTGPGELMMQSRNPDDIVRYVFNFWVFGGRCAWLRYEQWKACA